jgi:hypothetical protein
MSKGYSLGFLIVLLVVVLGLYVAISGFMSSREAQRAQSAAAASTEAAQPSRTATRPIPTPTDTAIVIPSPVPGLTATMTAMVATVVTEEALPTETPAPPPTEAPPAQPTDTPPVVQPPTPAPAYQFRLAGPPTADPNYQLCCYVYGTVKDAAGNGLEGIQVQAFNEWTTLSPALTKGGAEIGKYDIPIGREQVTWYVMIVDQAGNQISSQVQIQWNPDQANGFRIDWQRTY